MATAQNGDVELSLADMAADVLAVRDAELAAFAAGSRTG